MPVKDRIATWFIQHVIIPRREIIDKPGFVVTTFTEKNQTTYLRELFLPEPLFEIIETKIVQNYGEQGKQALYSAGKKFGYIYSSMSNFPTITNYSKKELSDFVYALLRYMEVTFSRRADHEINFEQSTLNIYFEDLIVCRNNGLGYIITDGGSAGIWAYLMQDKSLEAVQLECEGRGDKRCFVMCAPEKKIQEKTNNFFREQQLPEQKFDDVYKTMNEIRQTTYSRNSMKTLLDAGFFEYDEGNFFYKNIRFFGSESNVLYFLEQEIARLKDGDKLLFDICFEYGKTLQEIYKETDYQKFISDFFPALGFGDIAVLDADKLSIAAIYYPWTVSSETSKYIIFRGILSGFVSSSIGKKIEFKNFNIDIGNYLTLTITT
jgi:hypothetical protein